MKQPRQIKLLITGAHGLIGNLVYTQLVTKPQQYDVYGMARDQQPSHNVAGNFASVPSEKLRIADLTDFAAVQRAVEGIDVVVHLAADPSGEGGWQSVLANNIIGTQHLFEASHQADVQRVIFASTNQVVFGYHDEEPYSRLFAGRYDDVDVDTLQPIDETQPTRPLNYYACSKVFGEALAHMYAFTHGLSCICLRIGWVTPDDQLPDANARMLWCSQRDIVQMVERCINAPASLRFDVFFAQSANRYNLVDIQHARELLGYDPQDNAEKRWEAS